MKTHQENSIATALNVLDGLRAGAPISESAIAAMPKLVTLMNSFGEHDLARDIDAALKARVG